MNRFPVITELVYQPQGDILQMWAESAGRPSISEYLTDGIYEIVDAETGATVGFEIVEFRRFIASRDEPEFVALGRALEMMRLQTDEVVMRLNPQGHVAAEVQKILEYA